LCRPCSRLAINGDVNCSFHRRKPPFRVSCAKPSDFLPTYREQILFTWLYGRELTAFSHICPQKEVGLDRFRADLAAALGDN
jgi:hypothetical protein